MKVQLTIVADVDPVGLARYIAQYPGFAGDGPAEILATEAICAWENEGLLAAGSEPEVTFEPDAATQTRAATGIWVCQKADHQLDMPYPNPCPMCGTRPGAGAPEPAQTWRPKHEL